MGGQGEGGGPSAEPVKARAKRAEWPGPALAQGRLALGPIGPRAKGPAHGPFFKNS